MQSAYHDTKNTVSSGDDSVTSSTILRGEQLRRESVQDTIHDVAGESVSAIPAKERV